MKKLLPLFISIAVPLVLIAAFVVIKKPFQKKTLLVEEEVSVEIPQDQRPQLSLTPSADGHWLKLKIEDIKVRSAESLDYELIYQVKSGITQGVPGSIKLLGQKNLERDLLLGSESSGKFRYDEGVEEGTLTLRFRDSKGKLIGKATADFELEKLSKKGYKLILNVFGKQLEFTSG